MKAILFLFLFSFIIASCTKNTINSDTSGEVYEKYIGEYSAVGSQIRYRVGVDTTTSVDTFNMTISKFIDTTVADSGFLESKIVIQDFLGSGKTVTANASYSQIVPFAATALPNYRKIVINSETKILLNYSYYRINGVKDTSWFSGKINKIQ